MKTRNNISVVFASRGHLFGHEDAINQRVYTMTAKIYSANAEVYCIKTEDFIRKF